MEVIMMTLNINYNVYILFDMEEENLNYSIYNNIVLIKCPIIVSPVLFSSAAGLAGLQYGRRSPRVIRVAHKDFYGYGSTVFMVNFSS